MPELPDIELYREALTQRILHARLHGILLRSPFFLRTVDPPLDAVDGKSVIGVERLGKRIVIVLDDDLFLAVHLMIAGRLRWIDADVKAGLPSKIELGRAKFTSGTLIFTEASPKKRAALFVLRGRESLAGLDPGGVELLTCTLDDFAARLSRESRTLKRALTDPRAFSGIGNAYSDEILHAARLSPIKLTSKLSPDEVPRLYLAVQHTLSEWTTRLRREFIDTGRFPGAGEVTAFRPDFAVHGKFGKPCPACGHLVARIVRAENEVNYCPTCQTDGKVLADRSLSRLLKDDWPRTVEEWETE